MDFNKEIGTAVVAAQGIWVISAVYLYVTTPGTSLLSGSAVIFLVGGLFASAAVFGTLFYGLQRALASASPVPADGPPQRSTSIVAWLLPSVEAIVIFVAASWAFDQLENYRAGVPLQYVQQRDNFDYALKAFSVASQLEERVRPGRESGQIDGEIETRLVELMEAGVAKGRIVSDEFLSYLDPTLPEPYRNLIHGHELLVDGRRSGDVAKQTEGNELVRSFYQDFLPPKADAIIAKLGVQPQ